MVKMSIQTFILAVLESDEYRILYDKSIRNVQDLKEKQNEALNDLAKLVKKYFDVDLSLHQVQSHVNDCLNSAKAANYYETTQNINEEEPTPEPDSINNILKSFDQTYKENDLSSDRNVKNTKTVDTAAKFHALKLEIAEKKVKKMEKKLKRNMETLLNNNGNKSSYTLCFLCEQFMKVDALENTDHIMVEILSEVNKFANEDT